MSASADLVNAAAQARAFTLRAELLAPDGRVVATRETSARLAAGERRTLTQALGVDRGQGYLLGRPSAAREAAALAEPALAA